MPSVHVHAKKPETTIQLQSVSGFVSDYLLYKHDFSRRERFLATTYAQWHGVMVVSRGKLVHRQCHWLHWLYTITKVTHFISATSVLHHTIYVLTTTSSAGLVGGFVCNTAPRQTHAGATKEASNWALGETPAAATRGLGCCGSTNCLWHVTHGVLTPNVFYIMYATVIMVNYANIFPLQVYLTIRYNIF